MVEQHSITNGKVAVKAIMIVMACKEEKTMDIVIMILEIDNSEIKTEIAITITKI